MKLTPYRWTIEDKRDKTGLKRKVYWKFVLSDVLLYGSIVIGVISFFFLMLILFK